MQTVSPDPKSGTAFDMLYLSGLVFCRTQSIHVIFAIRYSASIFIQMRVRYPFAAGNKGRTVVEHLVHVFEAESLGFWQERPEDDPIDKIADNEDDVVFPSNCADGNRRDLSYHGVESKTRHCANAHTFHA